MKAEELRIGNYVKKDGVYGLGPDNTFQITANGIKQFNDGVLTFEDVPLAEEWLIRFGFNNQNPIFENINLPFFVKNTVCLFFNGSPPDNSYLIGKGFNQFTKYYCATLHWINSVHELQNIYYALTGEELTISEPTKQIEG